MNEAETILVKALRSGDYKQTTGHLKDDKGYCCLGVACDVYMKTTGNGEWKKGSLDYETVIDSGTQDYFNSGTESYIALTEEVRSWLGWRSEVGRIDCEFGRETLIDKNDNRATFMEIANIIEQGKVLKEE